MTDVLKSMQMARDILDSQLRVLEEPPPTPAPQKALAAEFLNLPSNHKYGDEVGIDFKENGKVTGCVVRGICFEGEKVYYDLSLLIWGQYRVVLPRVDGRFVTNP